MKQLFFAMLAGLTLASCSEISTDPAPTRLTRTAQTVTINFAKTASTLANDTLLVGEMNAYVLVPTVNADGTLTYPAITAATTPTFTTPVTAGTAATAQTYTVATNLVITENTPSNSVRVVLRTTNRPGRRTGSQRLTAALLINGTSRATATHQGTNFSRTAVPTGGFYTTSLDANLAGYAF
ncbi:hypothetical protein ACFST9_06730 [Hymenobacter monticola]|uniref:DUF1735 domain-containing protein n=1 Tax=Hymenobacter monticola TaxID=1705399 RepID=A0ABY4B237_9BACT|nr:hypothetical protein [Hymenobacter monticola]UOE31828.1 hypothetical protein MTP16_11850 [Hymenobacter monticola]